MNDDKLVKKKFCQSTTEKGWRRKDRKTKATAKLFVLHEKATKTTQFFKMQCFTLNQINRLFMKIKFKTSISYSNFNSFVCS